MQRQRRRDLNLKPNRVLDKRSSRGMIYENEELRLRTLAIADDVDRGQTDIKKLRKENDHLKREIWSLRDECEKLEEILKKVVSSGNLPFDLTDLPYPELLMDNDTESQMSDGGGCSNSIDGTQQGDDDDGQMSLFMMDDDTGSVVAVDDYFSSQGQCQGQQDAETWEEIPGMSVENFQHQPNDNVNQEQLGAYHHRFGGADTSGVLESLKEESESMLTLPQISSPSPPELPDPDDQMGLLGAYDQTPVIQITPASSPSNQIDSPSSPESVQDGGCITVVPKTYQVTSQIQIVDPSNPVSVPLTPPKTKKMNFSSTPFNENNKTRARDHHHSISGHDSHLHSLLKSQGIMSHGQKMLPVDWMKTGGLGGSFGGFIVNRFCPSCCQSEPSLASVPTKDDHVMGKVRPLTFDPMIALPTSFPYKSAWTCLEKNLIIGFVDNLGGNSSSIVIKSQDVIDELETQFDPSLEKIKGIRILCKTIFLCLRDDSCVSSLIDQVGGDFTVKNAYRIKFVDGSHGFTNVRLSGIGPEVTDDTVISVLNQFGQVVGPIRRQSYKGVEIWEREAQLHLVKHLPKQLIIRGHDVSLSVSVDGNETLCQLPVITTDTDIPKGCPPVSSTNNSHVITCQSVPSHSMVVNSSSADIQQSSSSEDTEENVNLKAHKAVSRSTSSNPRLELGPSPSSPVPTKRQPSASVCAETLTPESHPGRIFQKNPNAQQKNHSILKSNTATSTSSAPNLTPPAITKKPLSRLLKSSPGSLVPPTTAGAISSPNSTHKVINNTAQAVVENCQQQESPNVMRAAFYRGLSIDPRRGSTISQATVIAENNNTITAADKSNSSIRRNSSNFFQQGRFGPQQNSHQSLSQMNSNASSQFDSKRFGRNNSKNVQVAGGKREPLPWCGCWGNGFI